MEVGIESVFKWVFHLRPRYLNCKEYYRQDPADTVAILKHIS